jgi:lipoprotein-releasing system permease protein
MFHLAIRHLLARPRQTLLTFLGIFFAGTAYITITSFFLGFREFLVDQLVNNDAQIRIQSREEFLTPDTLNAPFYPDSKFVYWHSPPSGRIDNARILDPSGWYLRLEADPNVVAYSPQYSAQVIITRASATLSGRLIGCDAAKQVKVTNIQDFMIDGEFSSIAAGGNRVLLGEGLLKKLGTRRGEIIQMSSGRDFPRPFKVVGVFKTGIKTLDDTTAFASLADVQKINLTPNQVSDIAIRVKDPLTARALAMSWSKFSSEKIQSWDQINENFLNVFRIQDATRYFITAVILLVAGFGIYNILNIVVTQKRRDIAILRSMGFERRDVLTLFFLQGLILGVAGAFLGQIVGYVICSFLSTVPFGGGPLGGSGFLNISFGLDIYVLGWFLPVTVSIFASVLPARAASKLTPIEIIRAGVE